MRIYDLISTFQTKKKLKKVWKMVYSSSGLRSWKQFRSRLSCGHFQVRFASPEYDSTHVNRGERAKGLGRECEEENVNPRPQEREQGSDMISSLFGYLRFKLRTWRLCTLEHLQTHLFEGIDTAGTTSYRCSLMINSSKK